VLAALNEVEDFRDPNEAAGDMTLVAVKANEEKAAQARGRLKAFFHALDH
jgi:hypothetical protein